GMNDSDWDKMQAAYMETRWYDKYVTHRAAREIAVTPPVARAVRKPGFRQFFIFFERLTKLYTRDVGWLVGAALGAPVMMLFLALLLGKPDQRHVLLFIANLLAFFFGIFPAIEMMHSERAIYLRERMVNLKIPSYVMSKFVFLGAFGVFQAASIAAILTFVVKVDINFESTFLVLLSVQLGGVTAGLMFSTLAESGKLALLLMLAWLVIMLAFSGFVIRIPSLRDQGLVGILGPSCMRWGLGALMDLAGDVTWDKIALFGFDNESWRLNTIANGMLSVLPLGFTMLVLRLRDKV
ncbi:MAG: ABC transporter permease, partial [Deltaproteobacteria bacterium]|nr:ABC transporter permease [Deltaproteobacteria bacterium]